MAIPEHRKEGSNRNSTRVSSSRGDNGDEAEGTARAQKNKRKPRLRNWSDEQTQQLLDACSKLKEKKGRRRMRTQPKWASISWSVNGKTADECEGRMETLTKSFNKIQKYCVVHQKQFSQLSEEEFRRLKLATTMKSNWYYEMCNFKGQPENAVAVPDTNPVDQRISSSPAPVLEPSRISPVVELEYFRYMKGLADLECLSPLP